jgi:hypothetical protein
MQVSVYMINLQSRKRRKWDDVYKDTKEVLTRYFETILLRWLQAERRSVTNIKQIFHRVKAIVQELWVHRC